MLQKARKNLERSCAFLAAGQGTHREPGAVGIEASRKPRADIGKPARDFIFVHAIGAERQQALGHARRAGFLLAVECRPGRELDAQVHHRQIAIFHEINLGAARRLPMLDRQDGVRRAG
ncbi:hypothetical protein D3C83_26880 [compost metagenome]